LIGDPEPETRPDEQPAPELGHGPDPIGDEQIESLLARNQPDAHVISLHTHDRRPR